MSYLQPVFVSDSFIEITNDRPTDFSCIVTHHADILAFVVI